jgi:hypothetical protein
MTVSPDALVVMLNAVNRARFRLSSLTLSPTPAGGYTELSRKLCKRTRAPLDVSPRITRGLQ